MLQNGERAGLELPVPMAATGVEPAPFPNPREALRADTAVILSGRVLDPRPVPPSGRQVAISYNLVTNGDGVLVELELPYPAANVNLLVGGSGSGLVEVSDLNLEPQPPQAIGEAGDQDLYATWGRPSWQPGETIRFRVGPRHSRLASVVLGTARTRTRADLRRGRIVDRPRLPASAAGTTPGGSCSRRRARCIAQPRRHRRRRLLPSPRHRARQAAATRTR